MMCHICHTHHSSAQFCPPIIHLEDSSSEESSSDDEDYSRKPIPLIDLTVEEPSIIVDATVEEPSILYEEESSARPPSILNPKDLESASTDESDGEDSASTVSCKFVRSENGKRVYSDDEDAAAKPAKRRATPRRKPVRMESDDEDVPPPPSQIHPDDAKVLISRGPMLRRMAKPPLLASPKKSCVLCDEETSVMYCNLGDYYCSRHWLS